MHFVKKAVILLVALLLWQLRPARAQVASNSFEKKKQDAIEGLKKFPAGDTNRVNALLRILNTAIFLKEKKEVISYLPEAMALSRKLNYQAGLGNSYLQKASYCKSASDYKDALLYYDSALYVTGNSAAEEMHVIKEVALEQKGVIFYNQENYYTALDYFFESLKYITAGRENRRSRIYIFITEIYLFLNNLEKADEYGQKNIALVQNNGNALDNASVYFPVIDICIEKNELDRAGAYLDKLKPYMPDQKQVQINFGYYLKRGRISYLQQLYTEAYQYFRETYHYAVAGGHANSQATVLHYLSNTAFRLGDYEAGKAYALENLAMAEKANSNGKKTDALVNLSNYYHKTGNPARAFQLMEQAMQLKDSFIAANNIKQLSVLGATYEYGKQQHQIALLQNEKEKSVAAVRQKSFLNNIFIAFIVVLLFLGYLGYLNIRKGQQLLKQDHAIQQQKIIELEKNKQLLTIDAMLKGQEEERSRIAKDLHDGLGSLLSGTKLSFMNVKEMQALSPESSAAFDRSLSMLDNSIGDLRKVAHNLMPEALVKFGLHEALRDFCASIELSSGIKVLCHQYGEIRDLGNTAEMFIYRMVQELVNNAVKHAAAKLIIVQLSMNHIKTRITVEDDGKGFDKAVLSVAKSAGMANINYRVQYFNGSIDIVSSPGNGTSVNIELNV